MRRQRITDIERRIAALNLAVTLCAEDEKNISSGIYTDAVIHMAAKFDAFLTGCTLDYITGITSKVKEDLK